MGDQSKQFAFGKSEIDDCVCPLVTAGYKVGEGCHQSINLVAGIYDSVVLNDLEEDYGKITNDQAIVAWGNVIKRLEHLTRLDETELNQDMVIYEQALYNAESVAGTLGWEDDLDLELTDMQANCVA